MASGIRAAEIVAIGMPATATTSAVSADGRGAVT
jgi:hypothetical protein